jgi:phytanoyl-CoA hydroxylase
MAVTSLNTSINKFWEHGYVLLRNSISVRATGAILKDAQNVFQAQFDRFGYSDPVFDSNQKRLFREQPQVFQWCGKQVQHLLSLHRFGTDPDIIDCLKEAGLSSPSISTRPVLFFNHPELAAAEHYWKTPAHQDWRSMQGSIDSLVLWVPLMDVDEEIGPLEIMPGSHKKGLLPVDESKDYGDFKKIIDYKEEDFVAIETKMGDCLLFSSLLVHRSGNNTSNRARWSCHFRYNNLDEPTFIERGFPNPYLYRPLDKLLFPSFDTKKEINKK